MADDQRSLLGRRLGNYEILARLGAGGMGEVYLAEDTRLRRKVAVKVLPAAYVSDEHAKKRLLREARAAAALDHPNICAVYEIGEAHGLTFVAMHYVEGDTLAARLTGTLLDLGTTLSIATQVAHALTEAHRHGLVHRDIKPQNIMLSERGQVKVLDFGLAMFTGPAAADALTQSQLTQTGAIAGTVPYMSPEQARGEDLDARSDIFSFGSVLYELLTGRQAFGRANPADTLVAILTHDAQLDRRDNLAIPAELQRIVRKCLEKDRDQRY